MTSSLSDLPRLRARFFYRGLRARFFIGAFGRGFLADPIP